MCNRKEPLSVIRVVHCCEAGYVKPVWCRWLSVHGRAFDTWRFVRIVFNNDVDLLVHVLIVCVCVCVCVFV